jgi:hypothetical protein
VIANVDKGFVAKACAGRDEITVVKDSINSVMNIPPFALENHVHQLDESAVELALHEDAILPNEITSRDDPAAKGRVTQLLLVYPTASPDDKSMSGRWSVSSATFIMAGRQRAPSFRISPHPQD